MPTLFHRTGPHPRLSGHRGNSLHAPENTLPALDAVRAAGGNAAEIDIVLTADEQIVVMHDLLVDRTTNGTGAVADLTLAEVRALDAGAWFSPAFAGTQVPTLAEALAHARAHDLVLEVEVKEKRNLAGMATALAAALADPADRARAMLISFDHRWLGDFKAGLPGVLTAGIVHERYGDPLAVARSADLDQLSIDLAVWDADQARVLREAGLGLRCHAYAPDRIAAMERAGLDPRGVLVDSLRAGLIDTLSGDDVGWLATLAATAPCDGTSPRRATL